MFEFCPFSTRKLTVPSEIVEVREIVPPLTDQPEVRLVMLKPFGTLPISDVML